MCGGGGAEEGYGGGRGLLSRLREGTLGQLLVEELEGVEGIA